MPLSMKIGLGPGNVLHGDPASPIRAQLPIFDPSLLWPNGHPSQLVLSTCYTVAEMHIFLSEVD